jgi:hypothetical protein
VHCPDCPFRNRPVRACRRGFPVIGSLTGTTPRIGVIARTFPFVRFPGSRALFVARPSHYPCPPPAAPERPKTPSI